MSTAELDAAIRETKLILNGLFSKPKCSTKLLTKPPFRFIHDIVTATITATGFPDGLYHSSELDSVNFKSKEAKIRFLDELIRLVGICEGIPLEVRATKIVAGLEPLHTNRLLAGLGKAAMDLSLDRKDVVQRCLAGETPGQKSSPTTLTDNAFVASKATGDGEREWKQSTRLRCGDDVEHADEDKSHTSSFAIPELMGISLSNQIRLCNFDKAQTRSWVGHIVPKPKCSDKLLNRPPFRFLHDLIIAVGQATTFGLHIYTPEEMVSSSINNKAAKMKFLEKTIKNVSAELGNCDIEAKAAKIVAGLEPGHTCRLLQLLVVAATKPKVPDVLDGKLSNFENKDISVRNSDAEKEFREEKSHEETSSLTKFEVSQTRSVIQEDGTTLAATSGIHFQPENEQFDHDSLKDKQQVMDSKVAEFEGLSLESRIDLCNFDILQTGAWIGQLITKPKCSERLLRRPPFRFLHDLIMALGKETGFGMHIFTEEDKESSNMIDKSSKVRFLEKAIAITSSTLGDVLIEAKPAKIVAGLDCEYTCKFLQLLVVASTKSDTIMPFKNTDSGSVKSSLPDEDESKCPVSSSDEIKSVAVDLTSGDIGETSNESDINTSIPHTSEDSFETVEADSTPTEVLDCQQNLPMSQNLIEASCSVSDTLPAPSEPEQDKCSLNHSSLHCTDNEKNDAPNLLPNFFGEEKDTIINDDSDLVVTKTEVRSMRPTTARRRPPRVNAKRASPTPPSEKVADFSQREFFSDGDDTMQEEESESPPNNPLPVRANILVGEDGSKAERYHENEEHLAIVQKIVDDDDEGGFSEESKGPSSLARDQGVRLRLNLKKRSNMISTPTKIQTEANAKAICSVVQTLVQSTAPLGTCMDYVRDDMGKIMKEREMWYAQYREQLYAYRQEQQKARQCAIPIQRNIDSVEDDISEQRERAKILKATIIKNEARIKKLLQLMVLS